jgi:hypothetical protein
MTARFIEKPTRLRDSQNPALLTSQARSTNQLHHISCDQTQTLGIAERDTEHRVQLDERRRRLRSGPVNKEALHIPR